MAIKIGIAGTHSTGKTTFLNDLQSRSENIGLRVNRVSDIGSQAAAAGFPILRDHTFESTFWIMSQGAANELKAALDCDVLLVDRPVPDALGYLNAAIRWRGASLPVWQASLLMEFARGYTQTYDLLMKTVLDGTIPLGTAKERDDDLAFRIMVAEEMDGVFSQLEIGYLSLTVENAANHIEASLASIHAYPVNTYTHYMLDVSSRQNKARHRSALRPRLRFPAMI